MNDVLKYMDSLDNEDTSAAAMDDFMNSTLYRQRCLDKAKADAREVCTAHILGNVYKDAVPLSGEYKTAYGDELNKQFRDFILDQSPNGVEYYIHERQKKYPECGPACNKLLSAVESFVEKHYLKETLNPENINTDELVFDVDDPENIKALDVVSQDLKYPELSDAISDNVADTVRSEIARAKIEKEKNRLIEDQLAKDLTVIDLDTATESYNRLSGKSNSEIYTPSIMEGVMIGRTNKYTKMMESGDEVVRYTYRALEPFGRVYTEETASAPASIDELVFIEAVEELTKHYVLNTFRLERYDRPMMNKIAMEYAKS